MSKNTNKHRNNKKKSSKINLENSDIKNVIWVFDRLDRSGNFAFDLNRIENDKNLKVIFDKMLSYSTMTWASVKTQTHDKSNKSKNHFLNVDGLSDEAIKRFKVKCSELEADSVFSFALQNKLRIIGIKEYELFHVMWYDPNHEFYPVSR